MNSYFFGAAVLPILFILITLIYFYFLFLLRIGLFSLKTKPNSKLEKISILAAMRNEASNAERCMQNLVHLDYPKDLLEIIIIDDGSTDKTGAILADYHNSYPSIKIVTIHPTDRNSGNKKRALAKGITLASGNILLFTDADCLVPPGWVKAIMQHFDKGVGVVAGFSPLIGTRTSSFHKIIQLDSLASGIVAAGSIGFGSAVTCTGRNLAYRKIVYEEVEGFKEISSSVSGDDDLFLQLVHKKTKWKIKYATGQNCIVPSLFTKNFSEFLSQKKRHLSAGKYYPFKIQAGYFIFHLTNLSIFILPFYSLFTGKYILLSMALLISKLTADWLLIKSGSKKLNLPVNSGIFLLWEIFFLAYNLFVGPVSWFGKIKW